MSWVARHHDQLIVAVADCEIGGDVVACSRSSVASLTNCSLPQIVAYFWHTLAHSTGFNDLSGTQNQ